ncbi:hypothetical protein [Roseinatronobacter sp. S2]|uniref:hypothetical protein n=1 Tax=Roseinatronobacter sp. S2 TaxID=3035471 RepID=UPI00240F06CA|nr:hypothetical protein [Roseinatronobacter sp. S2]WFE76588.1 hypothetical protein P8S53_18895 [Roseinatronobacter sp. S2]
MAEQAANRKKDSTEGPAKKAAQTTEKSYEELKAQVDALKSDVAELSATALRAGEHSMRDTVARVRKTGRKAADGASEQMEYAADHVEGVLEDAEAFAQERPAVALALAAGAGFLLAKAMSRR